MFPDLIKAHVTAEHMAQGKPKDCLTCPVALALAPLFPGHVVRVRTMNFVVYDKRGIPRATYRFHRATEDWICNFDIFGSHAEPFELEASIDDWVCPI
jgi:hypothetical protein